MNKSLFTKHKEVNSLQYEGRTYYFELKVWPTSIIITCYGRDEERRPVYSNEMGYVTESIPDNSGPAFTRGVVKDLERKLIEKLDKKDPLRPKAVLQKRLKEDGWT